eukprot:2296952-Rhodomonas_salina.1
MHERAQRQTFVPWRNQSRGFCIRFLSPPHRREVASNNEGAVDKAVKMNKNKPAQTGSAWPVEPIDLSTISGNACQKLCQSRILHETCSGREVRPPRAFECAAE